MLLRKFGKIARGAMGLMTSDCPAEPASYRLFFLDEQGRIKKSRSLECAHDEEAIKLAHGLADGRTLELYDGCRLVLKLSPEDRMN